jgi:hypothetical protein
LTKGLTTGDCVGARLQRVRANRGFIAPNIAWRRLHWQDV